MLTDILLYVWLFAAVDAAGCAEEQILNCNLADVDDAGFENEDEEPVAMNEESPSGSRMVITSVHMYVLSRRN